LGEKSILNLFFVVISCIIRHISLIIKEIMNNYNKILDSGKTIFTKKDLEKILDLNTKMALDKFLYREKNKGFLRNIFYGIYALKNYNLLELAGKIRKKSYISLETVLKKEWVIFQYYDNIFIVSDDSLEKKVWDINFKFSKIKDSILLNQLGIEHKKTYTIASVERAVCDKIYLSKNYYFDDLSDINFNELEEISKIYDNKRVVSEVNKLIKKYAK